VVAHSRSLLLSDDTAWSYSPRRLVRPPVDVSCAKQRRLAGVFILPSHTHDVNRSGDDASSRMLPIGASVLHRPLVSGEPFANGDWSGDCSGRGDVGCGGCSCQRTTGCGGIAAATSLICRPFRSSRLAWAFLPRSSYFPGCALENSSSASRMRSRKLPLPSGSRAARGFLELLQKARSRGTG